VEPFYFQRTMGGNDINGDRELGSYPDYRFRAPNLLCSVEFRALDLGPFGAAIMADFGRVALARARHRFDHFRHSYATGLTIRPAVYLRSPFYCPGAAEKGHTLAYISPGLLADRTGRRCFDFRAWFSSRCGLASAVRTPRRAAWKGGCRQDYLPHVSPPGFSGSQMRFGTSGFISTP